MSVEHAPGPIELGIAGREHAVDDLELARMDAELAAKAERAGEPGLLLEAGGVADVEEDGVERRPQAGGGGVRDELRARVQELQPVGACRRQQFGAEVVTAERDGEHALCRGRLVRTPQPVGRLDDREHRRPDRPERRDRIGRRLREHEEVEREPSRQLEVVVEPLAAGRVHAKAARRTRLGVRPDRLDDRGARLPSRSRAWRPRDRPPRRPRHSPEPSGACAPRRPARRGPTSRATDRPGPGRSRVERVQVALVRELTAPRVGDLAPASARSRSPSRPRRAPSLSSSSTKASASSSSSSKSDVVWSASRRSATSSASSRSKTRSSICAPSASATTSSSRSASAASRPRSSSSASSTCRRRWLRAIASRSTDER